MSEEVKNNVVKGQAYIYEDSIRQPQTLIIKTNSETVSTDGEVVLVKNIWDNLLGAEANGADRIGWWRSKSNPNYFYWEYEQSYITPDGVSPFVKVKLECPQPKPGLIEDLFKDKSTNMSVSPKDWTDEQIDKLPSDWAKYWAEKLRTTDINIFKSNGIQKKEVTFTTRERFDYSGENFGNVIQSTTITESNNEFGNNPNSMEGDNLITDLLNMF